MATKQGGLALLDDPVAQELLRSTSPARLAYVWDDGTPRVVPIWFHAERYFGPEQGRAWVTQIGGMFSQMARIAVTPEWVAVLDFETRFPNAIENAMAGHG